jgi:hypothetical protein
VLRPLHRVDPEERLRVSARISTLLPLLLGGLAIALGLTVASWQLALGLNGDVRYVLGGLHVHRGDELLGFVWTFTHRPLAYRASLSIAVKALTGTGFNWSDKPSLEIGLRSMAVVLAGGAGASLWFALRRRLDDTQAGAVAVAVAVSLACAPNFDFLQPEWLATACVAVAVGAALRIRRPLVAASVAGSVLTLAVALKLGTAPLAPLGVLLIGVFDRHRAWLTTAAGLIAGMVWLVLVGLLLTEDWQWLQDMIALNAHGLLRSGLRWADILQVGEVIGSKAALSPVIALAPASVALLLRSATPRRQPWLAIALTLSLLLCALPVLLEGEGILYHAAALPVLSAALAGLAVVRWWQRTARIPWLLVSATVALSLVSVVSF